MMASLPRPLAPAMGWISIALGAAGCSGVAATTDGAGGAPRLDVTALQFEAAAVSESAPLDHADPSGGAWRIIEVPAASNAPSIVGTPSGWYALSWRSLGPARASTSSESALYRSTDGVHWQRLPLPEADDDVALGDLAYGAGRYVMVGARSGNRGVIWSSSDGERWSESAQPHQSELAWRSLTFAGGHFYAFGFGFLGISEDGREWGGVPISTVQPEAVAAGGGRHVLVGSGPVQVSDDGRVWREQLLDCALPGACISDPSGNVLQGYHASLVYAEGRFFTEQLSSADGERWRAEPGRSPVAYESGRFLGAPSLSAGLQVWESGGPVATLRVIRPARAAVTASGRASTAIGVLERDAPLPDDVDVSFEDGLDCTKARCLVIGSQLVLVPLPGSPPLPDRVPRDAAGVPLLSDDCPVSSQIFCADYATRSACSCRPSAPRAPADCPDVSQYRCEGAFAQRPGEWTLDELAQAGCSCDASDPNQPPTFGLDCTVGGTDCQAPLECLPVAVPPSVGTPIPPAPVCTSRCNTDADCPSWQATGFCAGPVQLRCQDASCQPRDCQ